MKLAYYPGCTLKTKALNMEDSALAALKELGAEVDEMPRWNCCGAVFSLSSDDLIHHIAPVRNLIRAQENGSDTIITLCSQCYNTLARANLLMKEDAEKRDTINRFMDEEPDYKREVQVMHYLTYLRDHVGFDVLRSKVKVPLSALKVAPFYGCSMLRPEEVAIDAEDNTILEDFLVALGATPIEFSASHECCGSYQGLVHPEQGGLRTTRVIAAASDAGANALVLSCPMCEYNLGTRQAEVLESGENSTSLPTYYFTQLLAIALGLAPEVCHFELNGNAAEELLRQKEYVSSTAV